MMLKIRIHLKSLICAASTKILSLGTLATSAPKIQYRFAIASHRRYAYKCFIWMEVLQNLILKHPKPEPQTIFIHISEYKKTKKEKLKIE